MNKKIITIHKSRIEDIDNQSRLVSEICIDGISRNIYFGVEPEYKECLTLGKADPFLVTLVNYAMRTNRAIVCEDPVSEELLFNLRKRYINTLSFWNDGFKSIDIIAESYCGVTQNQNAIGCAMSFGCDSMYSYYKHKSDNEYTVTHLCNFNNGVYFDRKSYLDHSKLVHEYATKNGIKSVSVDTNIFDVMPERFLDVYSQRNMACVLALQGLFSTYLYSSGHDEQHIAISTENSAYYDVISVESFSINNLQFILSGCECTRVEKLRALCEFEDAQKYLHPCFKAPIGDKNCGCCKKDIREMILFYAWGVQDKFNNVYDWSEFENKLTMNLALLISLSDDHLYKEVLEEYVKSGKEIPKKSYVYAQVYKKAMGKTN